MDRPARHSQFSLFQSHLDLAPIYWEQLVEEGDLVIDATCGNGHDTLKLATLAIRPDKGAVFAMDIQPSAIESCRKRLQEALSPELFTHIQFYLMSHACFPKEIRANSIKLIVYNLGYLPGGDKKLTTLSKSTLESLQEAQKLLVPGGVISLTCYPGHSEGKREQDALLEFVRKLDPKEWNICHHQWMNRNDSPSLLLLQKAYHLAPKTAA